MESRYLYILHRQWHDWWRNGNAKCHDISNRGIEICLREYSGFSLIEVKINDSTIMESKTRLNCNLQCVYRPKLIKLSEGSFHETSAIIQPHLSTALVCLWSLWCPALHSLGWINLVYSEGPSVGQWNKLANINVQFMYRHWDPSIITMPILSLQDKVGIMTIFGFQWGKAVGTIRLIYLLGTARGW